MVGSNLDHLVIQTIWTQVLTFAHLYYGLDLKGIWRIKEDKRDLFRMVNARA